jgi:predicted amidophosphoribosyltransferase
LPIAQQGFGLAERNINLRKAFCCSCELDERKVLPVHNVMISGATVRECSLVFATADVMGIRVEVVGRS